jgi:DNA-nicking Smr family endonuclease
MTQKPPPFPGERDAARAFEEAMSDARKLTGPQRVRLAPAPPGPGAPHKRSGGQAVRAQSESETPPFAVEHEGERWSARANGIDRAVLKKLVTGKIAIAAKLDLHGQSRKEALRALERFVSSAAGTGARALLIVHGRGLHSGDEGPALRDTVRDFLVRSAFAAKLLAAASAPPSLGGVGATVIWLRRPTAG